MITGESTSSGQGSGLKGDLGLTVVGREGRCDGQGGSKFPVGGKFQSGDVGEIVGLPALGIEQHLIPTDDRHFVGRGGTGREAAFEGRGRKEVEFGIHFSLAGWNVDVKGEAVEQIAPPLQGFAAGGEFKAGQVNDGTVGGMLAGNPLRVIERQVARAGGNFQPGVEDFAGSRSGVHKDGYGWRRS